MMTVKLPASPHTRGEKLYNASRGVILQPGVSVLVGCNGSGKTTFLQIVRDHCEENGIPCFFYSNSDDGSCRASDMNLMRGNIKSLATNAVSSEGEVIYNNFGDHVPQIGKFIHDHSGSNQVVICLDGLDSGGSIDNILELKRGLFDIILSTSDGIEEVYILVSANSYEFVKDEWCIDVTHGKYLQFINYEDYREFIISSRQIKNKRYHWDEFPYN